MRRRMKQQSDTCKKCNGTGEVQEFDGAADWVLVHDEPCLDCGGSGFDTREDVASNEHTVRISIIVKDDQGEPFQPSVSFGDSDILVPMIEDANGWHFDLIPRLLTEEGY